MSCRFPRISDAEPQQAGQNGFNPGHNFSCWNFAFNDAPPRILAALQPPTG
jgi:hypothetical protein